MSTPLAALSVWSILITMMGPLAAYLLFTDKTIIVSWEIVSLSSTHVSIPLILDPISTLFSSVVLFISANVLQFSCTYMSGDPFLKRFTHMVIMFILSMNMLIFIPHMICLLLGWDGLGLTSFILVIYYQNPKSLGAGMITALANRIGDVMILLAIAWTLNQGQWSIINMWTSKSIPGISLLIMVAAMTKSAQIPFSSWLPAAMAAPTPVSALVHSSTLVTAGVFLLIRFYPSLHLWPLFNPLLLLIASLTMFMAGIAAMVECDMKKIIALSTLSQLGVMMASLGLNLPKLALFHLLTHALFKALLFLCAGSLIHQFSHSQDLRSMGNLSSQCPGTLASMIIANLALMGSPFLAGFYSKDLILETSTYNPTNMIILALLFLSTCLTSAYSIRFLLSITWSPSLHSPLHLINDNDINISLPTAALTIGAIAGGSVFNWMYFCPVIEPIIPTSLKLLASISTVTGALMAWLATTYLANPCLLPNFSLSNHMMSNMWFLTYLSSQLIIKSPLKHSHNLLKTMDQGWNELTGGQGSLNISSLSSSKTQLWQNNMITAHLLLSLSLAIYLSIL